MALAVDASSISAFTTSSTVSWSHTCTGSDRVLFVGVGFNGSALSVTGVTYNGVAMTEQWDLFAANVGSAGYLLANPATGANTVEVTFNAAVDVGIAGAVSFTGADTASPGRTPVSVNGGSATASVDATDAVSGDIVVDTAFMVTTTTTEGANQTLQQKSEAIGGGSSSIGISTQAGADGGVMSWTLGSGANSWTTGAIAIKAGSGGGGGGGSLMGQAVF